MGETVAVIGAGMGGMTAAALLAHAGFDVTVIEAREGPGGKMRTLDSAAGPVDAGPTVLTMRPVFETLFARLGARLSDHVRLTPDPVIARHWWPDGGMLELFSDPEASAAAIRAFAGPRDEAAFRRFRETARRLFDAFDGPVMQAPRPSLTGVAAALSRNPGLIPSLAPGLTLAGALARRFQDPRLRQLFGRYATYVGGAPDRTPSLLSLIWRAEELGVWAVEGGMRTLGLALAALAEARSARFRYGAAARRIVVEGGRAAAVETADGARIPCGRVIFNGDPAALVEGLLGEDLRSAVPVAAVRPRSLSAWVWAFAARPAGVALAHHNVFFAGDPGREFGPIAAGRMPEDPTLYICAQDRGAGATPDGLERFEIIMNGAPTGAAPPEAAETCRTRTFETLARFGLSFDPTPATDRLTTPADFAALFPASQGSLYGLSPHGTTAAFRRPGARTRIPGLYLAGGGAHPGAGVPMATLSGMRAAEAIASDLASTSTSRRTATHGGMSTGSATTAAAPYR